MTNKLIQHLKYILILILVLNFVLKSNIYQISSLNILESSSINDKAIYITSDTNISVKIMTYNIDQSGKRVEWIDVVKEENADIIALVETGLFDDNNFTKLNEAVNTLNDYFKDEISYEGYTDPNSPQSYTGLAILSRFPILKFIDIEDGFLDNGTSVNQLKGPSHDFAHVEVNVSGTIINLVSAHLKCCGGDTNEYKRERDQEMINNYFDSLGDVPIIYLGDLNTHSPEDLKFGIDFNLGTGPISMLINESNTKTTVNHTWQDVYRNLNPDSFGASYISTTYNSRIDYIFVNQHLFGNYYNSTVGDTVSAEIGSDHFTVDTYINITLPEIIKSSSGFDRSSESDRSPESKSSSDTTNQTNASVETIYFLIPLFLYALGYSLKKKKII